MKVILNAYYREMEMELRPDGFASAPAGMGGVAQCGGADRIIRMPSHYLDNPRLAALRMAQPCVWKLSEPAQEAQTKKILVDEGFTFAIRRRGRNGLGRSRRGPAKRR